jgi:hypothetical protein
MQNYTRILSINQERRASQSAFTLMKLFQEMSVEFLSQICKAESIANFNAVGKTTLTNETQAAKSPEYLRSISRQVIIKT